MIVITWEKSLRHMLMWKGKARLPHLYGAFQLKFLLTGSTRLFSFGSRRAGAESPMGLEAPEGLNSIGVEILLVVVPK